MAARVLCIRRFFPLLAEKYKKGCITQALLEKSGSAEVKGITHFIHGYEEILKEQWPSPLIYNHVGAWPPS